MGAVGLTGLRTDEWALASAKASEVFGLRLVTNLLGPQALERSRRVRVDELDRFYKNLFDKAVKKESVEICEEALKLTNNSVCKLIMGRCCPEEGGVLERVKGLATELDITTKKILLANMLPPWLKKLVLSLFKKEVEVLSNSFNELLEKILVEHEEKQGEGKDLMDVLLAAYRDENAEYKITRNHIKSFYVVNITSIEVVLLEK